DGAAAPATVATAVVTDVVAEVEAGDAETADRHAPEDPESAVLRERDAALASVERELGRRLKRVLADEQNEVLDLLRRGRTVTFAGGVPAGGQEAGRLAPGGGR